MKVWVTNNIEALFLVVLLIFAIYYFIATVLKKPKNGCCSDVNKNDICELNSQIQKANK